MNAAVQAAAAVVVRRMITASPEELFDAWLDAEALGIWMRPTGIRHTSAKTEPRVGGSYEIIMQGDEKTYPHRWCIQGHRSPTPAGVHVGVTWHRGRHLTGDGGLPPSGRAH